MSRTKTAQKPAERPATSGRHVVKDTVGGYTFEPPPAGLQGGICVDVYDSEAQYGYNAGRVEKVLVFELPKHINPDFGRPHIVKRRYTPSLAEGSHLRRDLETWRNRPFADAELEGFDLERLINVQCTLDIAHSEPRGRFGRIYADVRRILPKAKGAEVLEPSGDYIRVMYRDTVQAQQKLQARPSDEYTFEPDDDLPF